MDERDESGLERLDATLGAVGATEAQDVVRDPMIRDVLTDKGLPVQEKLGKMEQILEARREPNWTVHGLSFAHVRAKYNLPYHAGSVGDGWAELLDRACADMVALGWDPERECEQIKEKYGDLRFYVQGSESVQDRATVAEEESRSVCEVDGRPGRLRHRLGWVLCQCDVCAAGDGPSQPVSTLHGRTSVGVAVEEGVPAGLITAEDGWAVIAGEAIRGLRQAGYPLELVTAITEREGGMLVQVERQQENWRLPVQPISLEVVQVLRKAERASRWTCLWCGAPGRSGEVERPYRHPTTEYLCEEHQGRQGGTFAPLGKALPSMYQRQANGTYRCEI
jgi:hypothetical protein